MDSKTIFAQLSTSEKKQIKFDISSLGEYEILQIYYILQNDEEKYTTNSNGVWFDLLSLKSTTQQKIYDYVQICLSNKKKFKNDLL